jgi:hypothetical protein
MSYEMRLDFCVMPSSYPKWAPQIYLTMDSLFGLNDSSNTDFLIGPPIKYLDRTFLAVMITQFK